MLSIINRTKKNRVSSSIQWPNTAILVMLLASIMVGCNDSHNHDHDQETDELADHPDSIIHLSDQQLEIANIQIGQPEKRYLSEKINCTGIVEVPPKSLASVYSPVQGFIKKVDHLPGDYVRKGEVLTIIAHPDLVRLQREFLESNSQISFLENDYLRKLKLNEGDATSQRTLEEAKAKFDLEQARHMGLKAELELMGISTQKLSEEGEIQSAIHLSSPVSGYVSKVTVNLGKLITPNDLLFEVVDNQHTHLELQVFAKDLSKIKKGQRIECTMPGSKEVFTGEVHLVGKMIDIERKTAIVHGHFIDEPTPLAPGTYLQATIFTDEKEVWSVPETALVWQDKKAFIFLKNKDGFTKKQVKTGLSSGGYVELLNMDVTDNIKLALVGAYYINGSTGEIESGHSH